MDTFIRIVDTCITEGYTLIAVDDDRVVSGNKCIIVNSKIWDTCPAKEELTNTLNKRLDSKRRGSHVKLSAITVCVLCSPGYSINHMSVSGVTVNDMKTVWGFIETTLVSSTETLSTWLRDAVAGRSQDGYCVNIDIMEDDSGTADVSYRPIPVNNMVKPKGRTTLVNTYAAALEYGGGPSITHLAIADSIMLNRLRFNNMEQAPKISGPTWGSRKS
jgi:hypothetical protein